MRGNLFPFASPLHSLNGLIECKISRYTNADGDVRYYLIVPVINLPCLATNLYIDLLLPRYFLKA